MRTLSPRLMLLVLGLLCAGSVGLALLAQHAGARPDLREGDAAAKSLLNQ